MKIAVAYNKENGTVYPHFGHAGAFKFYEVQDGEIVSSEIVEPEGQGHVVMVGLMTENNIDVVVCGRIGGHALEGLENAGIPVYSADGDADEAVKACLRGELPKAEAHECHHEHAQEEEHHCCHGSEEQEGGCGGCSGCHGTPQVIYEGKNAGKVVSVHYKGTLNDGTQFDSSYDRGEPLTFISGVGQMIQGFDLAVLNMEVGEEVDVHLMPEEAYGQVDPNAVLHLQIAQLPGSEELEVGQHVYLRNQYGQPFPVVVTEKNDTDITLDANHELAGKELNFHIQVVSIEEQ